MPVGPDAGGTAAALAEALAEAPPGVPGEPGESEVPRGSEVLGDSEVPGAAGALGKPEVPGAAVVQGVRRWGVARGVAVMALSMGPTIS
ncbi:hypothetical protein GCM10018793_67380 [Streptomyces sulfonofaciens]|uniref:Uncharacterized protein n=1 Tax=Streptomyces sulfonofaciens TaxID=68272 RepID=A0A919L8U2_9ACTN|nr:hypothetical protein GCM10018793_67380 [Streptomyces sulfonofaciens]